MVNNLIRQNFFIVISLILLLILLGTTVAYTANNSIPTLRLSQENETIYPNSIKPNECAALNLLDLIQGTGTINGSSRDELILGSTTNDRISGKQGNDCILGGSGDDAINGNKGYDVCIGGPGNDSFKNCEETIQ